MSNHRTKHFALFSVVKKTAMIAAFIVLLLFPKVCITGAQNGLLLWYSKVLPVLLPFFIISSFITCYIHTSPIFTTLCFGILCGYPMGAKNIKEYFIQGFFSKREAESLLCISNHASPMFLIGYVFTMQLKRSIPLALFLFCIYWPPFLYGIYLLFKYKKSPSAITDSSSIQPQYITTQSKITFDDSIEHSMVLICKIGCYIMLYSIVCNLLLHFADQYGNTILTNTTIPLLTGILEMTTGIANISTSTAPLLIKTAMITGIASFGGCSSISQIHSALKGTTISIKKYVISKIIYGTLSAFSMYAILILI